MSIAALFVQTTAGECDPPPWFGSLPAGYTASRGVGSTADEAMRAAWRSLLAQLARTATNRVEEEFVLESGRENGLVTERIRRVVRTKGVYYRNGRPLFTVMASAHSAQPCSKEGFVHYLLVCRTEQGCRCRMSAPSDGGALLRSAVVPGWGQAYKGRGPRAVGFGGAVAVLAGGAALCFPLGESAARRAGEARTVAARNTYTHRRDALYYGGIGLSITALIVYGWNLFDARHVEGVPELR
jgi:hypothetical protein